jgi:hypothetical protein
MPDRQRAPSIPPASDSPWFWTMLFCAAGLVILAVAWPQYAKRQARIELQYHAGQEIMRRRATGEAAARQPGQEGAAQPPVAGEPMIRLWPIAALLALALAVSAAMFWRGRTASLHPPDAAAAGEPP